ncbi:general secretion pathway protein GspB [Alteromonas sp. ASW11-130]|uniref:general secretion pathway protein GspB n=1 Tax=Alteromonas sp. ASW11-130 TaxID=3015775 RepID=UPI0022426E41|nr:general secretion pathway protein GspB [Alteromonas sp. ASW11-130]MCW8092809.1 general secretion pathway protein GspB [Alteromonas sp. ASW11-130]
MSERVLIEKLHPGMVITRVTQQNGPVAIQKSGLVSSDSMVQGLAEMGVQEVEIDPDLTVELAPKVVSHQTQTQALLRGQHDTAARSVATMDSAMSDQFNRSLFLPTVQSIPSVWQVYAKEIALFLLIILSGLGIGFSAGSAERWWPNLASSFSTPDSVSTAAKDKEAMNSEVVSADIIEDSVAKNTSDNATQPSDSIATKDKTDEALAVPTPSAEVAENEAEPMIPITKSEPAYEGKVLNEPVTNKVDVSPELMAKFNEAVESLALEKENQTEAPKSNVKVHSDVQRVDQLPVRILTRLPSMKFSAHMYASNSQDRWVRVNGKQLGEGDWISDRVQIVNIEGQRVILNFENELFSMAALTDW